MLFVFKRQTQYYSNEVRAANQLGVKFEFLQIWASTEREHVPCHSMDAYILVFIIWILKSII